MVHLSRDVEPKRLRPGEIRILQALTTPKKTEEIYDEIKLNRTFLTKYLKRLQKLGLITRDIDTRKFKTTRVTEQKLFYNDISDFLTKQMELDLNAEKQEDKTIIDRLSWMTILDDKAKDLNIKLKEELEKPKALEALNSISEVLNPFWFEYVLSLRNEEEQKTIREYKNALNEAHGLLFNKPDPKTDKDLQDLFSIVAEEKLFQEFPDVKEIPKEMIESKAKKELDDFIEWNNGMYDSIVGCDTPTVEALTKKIKETRENKLFFKKGIIPRINYIKEILSPEEEKRLKDLFVFLEKPKNKKIYEGYLNSVYNQPKTMIVFPLLGFKGYQKKLESLFPENNPKKR